MKKVAAYCRVSTDKEDQKNSLENQIGYFKPYIERNPDWLYVDTYVDEGLTGTNINKREGFKRMLLDAKAGKIDLILTKEISRFARNTLDALTYTRQLKELGVGILFLNENINTMNNGGEMGLTIFSTLAQDESRKTSERVKWGQKRQMEKGVVFGTSVYGYFLKGGKLSINEEQAKVVRLIFDLYLNQGMGTHILCHELENRGIRSPSGDIRWKNASILRMLKNEKYMGTLKQRKEITLDFLSHKKVPNNGREEYIVIENNHEPIISKEMFEAVQIEITRRWKSTEDKSHYSNKYVWSGKVECAYCHSKYRRKVWNRKKNPSVVWQCGENIKYGSKKLNEQGLEVGCNSKAIHDTILSECMMVSLNAVTTNKSRIIRELKQALKTVLNNTNDNQSAMEEIQRSIDKVQKRKTNLIEIFTDGAISREEFDNSNNLYLKQLEQLNKELVDNKKESEKTQVLENKMEQIEASINSIVNFQTFSEEVIKQVLDKLVVYDREKIEVYLKGGNSQDPFISPLR